jgi:hypothetical protein
LAACAQAFARLTWLLRRRSSQQPHSRIWTHDERCLMHGVIGPAARAIVSFLYVCPSTKQAAQP